jgi:hypothetical protein|tara:strand:- start:548 stop:1615 length:1068 start_codon:yes stop_codon:yes gene_type:complete
MNIEKKSQTSINSEDFQGILESIGYTLIDCGDHWRAQALYRDGDNKTALKIYKNTGVWMDFVENRGSKPFEALVSLTTKDKKETESILANSYTDTVSIYQPNEKIQMERIYPESSLDKLFPNYNFYDKKGISEKTQRAFQVGLAGVGKMYRRMVFPVYNEHSQIIGFSGRKVDENNTYPKWKHIGKRNNWVYPAFNSGTEVGEEIEFKKQVILVESIGDALALYEQGIKNVLVLFGLSVNSNIINYLSGRSVVDICISTNNDSASRENRGLIAAVKSYIKLSSYFDLGSLSVKFPPKSYNDFGDAHVDNCDIKKYWLEKPVDQDAQLKYICNFVKKSPSSFTKKEFKTASLLSND